MKRNKVKRNNNYLWFYGLIFILILSLNIGFSAYQNKLTIENISAIVRIDEDIRITSIGVNSANNATSLYEEYSTFNISGSVKLDNADSYVIYEVEVCNLGNVPMGIREAIIDNDNLKYEFLDYELKSKICEEDQCSLGIKKKLKVKISYKDGANISEESNNFILSFKFGRIFNITYYNISDSDKLPTEVIEGDTLNLIMPNKEDYLIKIFMNNSLLQKDIDYQHEEDNLVLPNVSGDIQVYYKMPICQRATRLHTEECKGNYCASAGYKVDGNYGTTTITYGSLGTMGSLASGDAFDCDVNGDGIYDAETERFYYVTDMKENSNVAILIYYNNVSEGKPNNAKYYQYDSSGENWHGPRTAIEQLPTTSQWANVSLFNTERKLVNEYGTTSTKDGHTYPEVLSYSKYAARLLTLSEVRKIVDFYIPSWKNGEFPLFCRKYQFFKKR